jgi:tripartite-type tricarboxylate transporter receptor subunit TctC
MKATRTFRCIIRVAVFAAVVAQVPSKSLAQAEFYKGKQIAFVVSTGAGTGYDTSARLIAHHLSRNIPGSPNIVVQNMTGAGGLIALNWLYNIAPKDGLTVAMVNTDVALNPIYGDTQAKFKPERFNWLGSPAKETGLLVAWHTSPIKSLADARSHPFLLGATGMTSQAAVYSRVLAYVLDFKMKLIPGYATQLESLLAMERGENDGNAAPYLSSLKATKAEWLRDKKVRVLAYYGDERVPEIDAPYVFDLIKDPEKRAVMQIAQAGLALGRPIIAPPGIPPTSTTILREALAKTLADPQYLQACAQAGLACGPPVSGAELERIIKEVSEKPKAMIEKASALFFTDSSDSKPNARER